MYTTLFVSFILAAFKKKLLFATYIPGVEIVSYVFWIINVLQHLLTILTIKIITSYLNLTISFIVFGTAQLQVLQYKISLLTLKENYMAISEMEKKIEDKLLRDNILRCIKTFIQIKEY